MERFSKMMSRLLPILLIGRLYVTHQTPDCCNPPNINLIEKKASQSSNYCLESNADRAFDGNRSTCSRTLEQTKSWWTIDLQSVYNISCISIYNKECEHTNIMASKIYIGNSPKNNGTTNKLVHNITNFQQGQTNVFKLSKSVFGRYITVTIENNPMVICDVNITGTVIEPPFCYD